MEVSATSVAAKPEDIHNPSSITTPSREEESQRPQILTQTRSDHLSNPYPTTFVQADTSTFKQVVQILTGSSGTTAKNQEPPPFSIPPIKNTKSFKLYERRQNTNNKNSMFMINTLRIHSHSPRFSPRNPEILLSPSTLDFPKLGLNSPVTPLRNGDPFDKASPLSSCSSEEEKAIAEKGFYLHPSPVSTPRHSEPQLLSLFPVTSPKLSSDPYNKP
ncbi:PREDICTED: VQ motif-containing protein 33-like [Tarenaya hassleriana]|uniref:VQ motif-containing protein 33-like n=1 Tax=Tarenaya hassleriana TaxID=28532 RepID=UPI00053C9AF3|nr:PREDICTED: VQ motif-containing protein 33-like [Tarenaya hassleriana]